MYMSVVGGSIVPDMVTGIGSWFAQLTGHMVDPARTATASVTSLFETMAKSVSGAIDGLIKKIPGVGGALSQVFNAVGGVGGILSMFGIGGGGGEGGGLGGLFGGLGGGGAAAGMGGFPGLAEGGGGWGGAIELAVAGFKSLGNHLKGGEEGMIVNPERDVYFTQHGGLSGLSSDLTSAVGADRADDLLQGLYQADKRSTWDMARKAVDDALEKGDAAGGTITINIQEVHTTDADAFARELPQAIRQNREGLHTQLLGFFAPAPA
jgi:hypothetical protein